MLPASVYPDEPPTQSQEQSIELHQQTGFGSPNEKSNRPIKRTPNANPLSKVPDLTGVRLPEAPAKNGNAQKPVVHNQLNNQTEKSDFYEKGKQIWYNNSIKNNRPLAITWFQRGANEGCGYCMEWLGDCFTRGRRGRKECHDRASIL